MVNTVYMYIVYPIPKLLYKFNDQKVAMELDLNLFGCLLCMYTMAIKGKGPPNPNPTWLNQHIDL